jgi:hypothetical protein
MDEYERQTLYALSARQIAIDLVERDLKRMRGEQQLSQIGKLVIDFVPKKVYTIDARY